jgi:YbbR domain-containing protein
MIKFLRELCFNDFWLKLFSLALAVLIWLTVSFAIQKEAQVRTFSNLPVTIVSSAQDVSHLKPFPAAVEVTVQGQRNMVQSLRANDIRVSVDVTGMLATSGVRKRLAVSTLAGISLVRVEPEEVEIDYSLP